MIDEKLLQTNKISLVVSYSRGLYIIKKSTYNISLWSSYIISLWFNATIVYSWKRIIPLNLFNIVVEELSCQLIGIQFVEIVQKLYSILISVTWVLKVIHVMILLHLLIRPPLVMTMSVYCIIFQINIFME